MANSSASEAITGNADLVPTRSPLRDVRLASRPRYGRSLRQRHLEPAIRGGAHRVRRHALPDRQAQRAPVAQVEASAVVRALEDGALDRGALERHVSRAGRRSRSRRACRRRCRARGGAIPARRRTSAGLGQRDWHALPAPSSAGSQPAGPRRTSRACRGSAGCAPPACRGGARGRRPSACPPGCAAGCRDPRRAARRRCTCRRACRRLRGVEVQRRGARHVLRGRAQEIPEVEEHLVGVVGVRAMREHPDEQRVRVERDVREDRVVEVVAHLRLVEL